MFPFSITFKRKISLQDSSELINKIEEFVKDNRGTVTEKKENSLRFRSAIPIWNWELFGLVDGGLFTINQEQIVFRFTLYRLFVVTIVLSLFMGLFLKQFYFGIGALIFLGIGNWITTVLRCSRVLDDVVSP